MKSQLNMTANSVRRTTALYSFARDLVVLLGLVLVAACGSSSPGAGDSGHPLLTPENAFSDGPPPASAQEASEESFAAMLDDGSLRLVTAEEVAQDEADALARMEEDRVLAEALYAGRPDILARHTMGPAGGDPAFTALGDGTWLYHMQQANPASGREDQYVVLKGNATNYGELVHITQRFNERENQAQVYRDFHGRLDPDYVNKQGLPAPESTGVLTFDQLKDLNDTIAKDWPGYVDFSGALPPPGYPANWMAEEGSGYGGDSANLTAPTGLWSKVNFPLKWRTTSVKWQGTRGTCTAFAVTGAVECVVARDQNRWVNLSEQMLYNRAKQVWWPSTYGDSLNTGGTLQNMLVNLYRYSWESSWDYNPSAHRIDLTFAGLYALSCWADAGGTPYAGEHCSDSNHQATMTCIEAGGYSFCGFSDPADDVPPDAQFRIAGFTGLNDPGIIGTVWAKAMLALGVPVVLSFTVPVISMDGNIVSANNGIVTYIPGEPSSGTGHAMLLVGYVANADLPPGTPPGSGGGYFICKNSWSANYGDHGYLYLPDDWVTYWSKSLHAISGVVEN